MRGLVWLIVITGFVISCLTVTGRADGSTPLASNLEDISTDIQEHFMDSPGEEPRNNLNQSDSAGDCRPPALPDGYVTGQTSGNSWVGTFTCKTGSSLVGQDRLKCRGGVWSSQFPVCTGIPLFVTCDDHVKVYFDGVLQFEDKGWESGSNSTRQDNTTTTTELVIPSETKELAIECQSDEENNGILASTSDGLEADESWLCTSNQSFYIVFVETEEDFNVALTVNRPSIVTDRSNSSSSRERIWGEQGSWAGCKIMLEHGGTITSTSTWIYFAIGMVMGLLVIMTLTFFFCKRMKRQEVEEKEIVDMSPEYGADYRSDMIDINPDYGQDYEDYDNKTQVVDRNYYYDSNVNDDYLITVNDTNEQGYPEWCHSHF